MSPILVRPVREQLEHDRIIRLLQTKCRRKFEVGMNPGSEQNAAVANGASPLYPDLVLQSQERGHRLQVVIEVETGESVNHLEALAEWAHFARLRAAFHLYVPSQMVDVARRLCEDNHIVVHEFWSYHFFGDEARFTLVHRSKEAVPVALPESKVLTTGAIKPARAAVPVRPTKSRGAAKGRAASATRPAPSSRRAAAARPAAARRKPATAKRPGSTAKEAAATRKPARKKSPSRAQKRR